MKYFIRSPYWTRNYKAETWWKPDSNGYTYLIADAGVYTEEDKTKMQKYHETDRCEFVPITQEIWEKAMEQLEKKDKTLLSDKLKLSERYEEQMNEIENDIKGNVLKYDHLNVLAKELQNIYSN